jgi:hypothetical protein
MFDNLGEELKTWLLKPLVWALMAVSAKLAVQSQKQKLTWGIVITAFAAGIGSAYIFSDYVVSNYSHEFQPMIIASIAISGDKIVEYLLYKVKFQALLDSIMKIFNSK